MNTALSKLINLPNQNNIILRYLGKSQFEPHFKQESNKILLRYLHPNELDYYKSFKAHPNRKIEWLMGRLIIKDCFDHWTKSKLLNFNWKQIEIKKSESGQPYLFHLNHIKLPPISITHCHGEVYGALSLDDSAIGIDVEIPEKRKSVNNLIKTFTNEELSLLNSDDVNELLVFWSAKEAAAKASGKGLQGIGKEWLIKKISKQQIIQIQHQNTIYDVVSITKNNFILSICQFY